MKIHTARRFAIQTLCALAVSSVAPLTALAAPPTWLPIGQPSHSSVRRIDELKSIYLECDRASRMTVLDANSAGFCSTAAEELRRTGFDGRFEDLFSWWRGATQGAQSSSKSSLTSRSSQQRP